MNLDRVANNVIKHLPEDCKLSLSEWDRLRSNIKHEIWVEISNHPIERLDVKTAVVIHHEAATKAGLPTAYVVDQEKFDRVTSDAGKNIRLKDES